MVSFATNATDDTQLITSVDELKNAVDALSSGGSTNHADAFAKATQLFDPLSGNARVIVMFTDGNTTTGAPPAPVAAAARAQGIIIYCIGLIGSDGLDVSALNEWATDPDASHVAVTPDAADLEAIFAELAANISKTGATDIVINEVLNPDFTITSLDDPTRGSASTLDSHTIPWTIPALGVTGSESAVLEFFVRHTSEEPGEKLVNESIEYTDAEGNLVVFPKPKVTVDCSVVVQPDPCPVPVDLVAEGCKDTVLVDMGDVFLESQGRILQLLSLIHIYALGALSYLGVVRYEHDGVARLMQFAEDLQNFTSGFFVQIAGGLIGQDAVAHEKLLLIDYVSTISKTDLPAFTGQ